MSPVRVLSQFAEHQAYIRAARRFLPGKSLTIDLHQRPSTPALGTSGGLRFRSPKTEEDIWSFQTTIVSATSENAQIHCKSFG